MSFVVINQTKYNVIQPEPNCVQFELWPYLSQKYSSVPIILNLDIEIKNVKKCLTFEVIMKWHA